MRPLSRVPALLGLSLCLLTGPAWAQGVDMDLMARWSAVTVVRYAVVGEFAGDVVVMRGAQGIGLNARVTDRVELTFDWNQNETALVGAATFKNFPSGVTPTPAPGCPPARINGTYDHTEITAVQQFATVLQIAARRSYPGGAIPYAAEEACGAAWDEAAAGSEPSDLMLTVPPTLFFGAPSAGGPGLTISQDGKSMILVEPTGWTWTFTPTPVR